MQGKGVLGNEYTRKRISPGLRKKSGDGQTRLEKKVIIWGKNLRPENFKEECTTPPILENWGGKTRSEG